LHVNIAANGGRAKVPRGVKQIRSSKAMAVIGRLDNQVEEVLIAPIARRHEQKNREREAEKQSTPEEPRETESDENNRTDITK
jgi:hypothetical protein